MKTTTVNGLLIAVVVVEAIVLVPLTRGRAEQRMAEHILQYGARTSPIEEALQYESPLWRFEEIVKSNPQWVNYRPKHKLADGREPRSILSSCATLDYTNHIRILLNYGADANEAIQWEHRYGSDENAALIESLRKEQSSQPASGSHPASTSRKTR